MIVPFAILYVDRGKNFNGVGIIFSSFLFHIQRTYSSQYLINAGHVLHVLRVSMNSYYQKILSRGVAPRQVGLMFSYAEYIPQIT